MTLAASDAGAAATPAPNAPETATLTLTRKFAARPEAVFDAFTIAERFARWWGPRDMTVPDCRIDLRVGGSWRTCMRSAEGTEHCVHGVYREIRRPSRLVFTWAWEQGDMAGVETLVTLEFAAAGEGTELRAPLAVTVVAGLTCATLLTLVVIPSVYVVVESLIEKRAQRIKTITLRPEKHAPHPAS